MAQRRTTAIEPTPRSRIQTLVRQGSKIGTSMDFRFWNRCAPPSVVTLLGYSQTHALLEATAVAAAATTTTAATAATAVSPAAHAAPASGAPARGTP
ncbi:hypothetical protein G7Z17_g9969 [Cylindrodendrum hubeiense]|uniref:Uncharacterized protein n=1 Tax=Cylindrodendrum hubeiense TaxID=595255 RepID=A0A9P5H2B9_9HYPO|nr:hypothetical protein G7Z17_g9969 [Cylindrodendrum hubeiense]